jgi:PAS domain S-box-containing protein
LEQIQVIAPYSELVKQVAEINKEFNWNIAVTLGNLEESISLAQTAQQQGVQAIISRGGTASLIRNHVGIPVIDIMVTGYDVLTALYPYQNSGSTLGIIGYRNVVDGCKTISKMLNIPIHDIVIPNETGADWNSIHKMVTEMIRTHRIRTIIGDMVVASKYRELEVEFKLITSGKEAVIQAIDVARNVIRVREAEIEKAERFRAVLDFVHDGVLVTDEGGLITATNPCFETVFGIKGEELRGKSVTKIITNSQISHVLETGSAELAQIQSTPTGQVIVNSVPILVDGSVKGAVSTFIRVSEIQSMEQKIRQNLYAKGFVTKYTFNDIITKDERMLRLLTIAKDYAKTGATVLIVGESGTGKEMFAQSIHRESPKAKGPFVAVNCAALSPQLLESELFGYVEGAFTGAVKGGKNGLFELAHNGTIFLDEISELALPLQSRLLRTLQEKQVMRLGSEKIIPIDIRVVAATNINLKQAVRSGAFREDLYYRINVLNLNTIPLRERKNDVEYLCHYFLQYYNREYGKQIKSFHQDVISLLTNYDWPGNIRELKNIIERIVISTNRNHIVLSDIDLLVEELQIDKESEDRLKMPDYLLQGTLEEIKLKIIKGVLEEERYNKSRTAKRLNIDRSTINRLL